MKKAVIFVILAIVAVVTAISITQTNSGQNADYLRIHIKANSGSAADGDIKYKIKERVVDALEDELEDVSSKEEAMDVVKDNLGYIKSVCDATLAQYGCGYTCAVRLADEDFPARNYGSLSLEGGVYDALIIELGGAQGDDWWCVVFPPVCFSADSKDVTYKSLFAEWFEKLFSKGGI